VGRRETFGWIPLAYAAGLVLLAAGASKKRPPAATARARARAEGPGDHDVISYVVDTDGKIYVRTQAEDVEWGMPKLSDKVMSRFRDGVRNWQALIDEAGVDFRVPSAQIAGEMWAESEMLPNLTSKKGAIGLMQVMPFHFSDAEKPRAFDPRTNIRKGTAILAQARAGFRDLVQVASMYNAGGPQGLNGGPWTNEVWLSSGRTPTQTSRWGYASEPGYIDRVVAANNTYLLLKQGQA